MDYLSHEKLDVDDFNNLFMVMNREIKKWWESHRLKFNVYIIVTGLLCPVLISIGV
jgi:hypothetical protein